MKNPIVQKSERIPSVCNEEFIKENFSAECKVKNIRM